MREHGRVEMRESGLKTARYLSTRIRILYEVNDEIVVVLLVVLSVHGKRVRTGDVDGARLQLGLGPIENGRRFTQRYGLRVYSRSNGVGGLRRCTRIVSLERYELGYDDGRRLAHRTVRRLRHAGRRLVRHFLARLGLVYLSDLRVGRRRCHEVVFGRRWRGRGRGRGRRLKRHERGYLRLGLRYCWRHGQRQRQGQRQQWRFIGDACC